MRPEALYSLFLLMQSGIVIVKVENHYLTQSRPDGTLTKTITVIMNQIPILRL